MSLRYYIRCDLCRTELADQDTPNPEGWHRLADYMYGTLGTIDMCPGCLEKAGLAEALRRNVLEKAHKDALVPHKLQLDRDPDLNLLPSEAAALIGVIEDAETVDVG